MGNFPTEKTPQEILNYSTDYSTNPPTLVSGGMAYHPEVGWIKAPHNGQHPQMRIEYDSNSLAVYMGTNASVSAADSDATWIITKYTYVGTNMTYAKTLVGSWDGRAALLW